MISSWCLNIFRSEGGAPAVGDPLPASTLTRVTGSTTYPPQIDFSRPVDWYDGIYAVMQRSQDPTFSTGVSEAINQIYAATTSYDFGLSSVTTGNWYFRMGAWETSRPSDGNMLWSNIINVGDTVAPTITSSASQNITETVVNPTFTVTASEAIQEWSILAGGDGSSFSIAAASTTSATVTFNGIADWETDTGYTIDIRATDYAGFDVVQTITVTVDNVDDTVNAFTFTDVTNATISATYTSNSITIAGLDSGISVPVTVTGGTYQKNGTGGYVSTAGTATNGDTFTVRGVAPGTTEAVTDVILNVGGVTDTYSIATSVAPAVPRQDVIALWLEPDTTDLKNVIAGTGAVTDATLVGYWADKSGNANHLTALVDDNTRPTYRAGAGIPYVDFDGGDAMRKQGFPDLFAAGSYTAVIAGRINPIAGDYALAQGNNANTNPILGLLKSKATAAADASIMYRFGTTGFSYKFDDVLSYTGGLDNTDRVYIIVDTGTAVTVYRDGVAGPTLSYSRTGMGATDPFNILSLGAQVRTIVQNNMIMRTHGLWVWPGLVLDSTQMTQILKYAGNRQGRSL